LHQVTGPVFTHTLLLLIEDKNEFYNSICLLNDSDCIEDDEDDKQHENEEEQQGFSMQLRASMDSVKEGDAVNLTCETPPGKAFHQQWLHPQNQARTSTKNRSLNSIQFNIALLA